MGECSAIGRPFLRWAGGKTWLVRRAEELFGSLNFKRYHEPFVGGGSFFFSLPIGTDAVLSDKNDDLIETYEAVKDDPDQVISLMKEMNNTEMEYYFIRRQQSECRFERAARFIFLNQTSYNGIYRVNLKGEYNVPYGFRSKPFLDAATIRDASCRLRTAKIVSCDFTESLETISEGDLVFLDPPYTVSHNKNGFVKYNQSIFSLDDQYRLADFVQSITERGAFYILTNAAHQKIYEIFGRGGQPLELGRANLIGGRKAQRGHTTEYVFTNLGN